MSSQHPFAARLRPTNAKKGFPLRRYALGTLRFIAGGPWQIVTAERAEKLRTIRERCNDARSEFAFEVVPADQVPNGGSVAAPAAAVAPVAQEEAPAASGIVSSSDLPAPAGRRGRKKASSTSSDTAGK